MNIKIFFLSLLFSLPTFSQQEQNPPRQGHIDIATLDYCESNATNYALFVYIAHNTKDQATFKAFVEKQIAQQQDSDVIGPTIRKFAEEAWVERNIPPTIAALEIFHQCERAFLNREQSSQKSKSGDIQT